MPSNTKRAFGREAPLDPKAMAPREPGQIRRCISGRTVLNRIATAFILTPLMLAACAGPGAKTPATNRPVSTIADLTHALNKGTESAPPIGTLSKPEPAVTTSATVQSVESSGPAPLAASAVAKCPVSLPNLEESPNEYYISTDTGYANLERTMFIGLWPGGKVFFCPDCAGSLPADGSLGMKFWFYRTVPGEIVIEGRQLDQTASPAHLATLRGPEDGYGVTGFHPAGLKFPSQGCWEVTARIGDAEMTFVTLIVWVPYNPAWPAWLPKGTELIDTDLTYYPDALGLVFRNGDGLLTMYTGEISLEPGDTAMEEQQVDIGESHGNCYRSITAGALANELKWSVGDLAYGIRDDGIGLSCTDLLRVAGA